MKKEDDSNNSTLLSETTRKIFLTSTSTNLKKTLFKLPSSLFSPSIITAKGLYPPPFITNNIPIKSLSVPIKLITMTEHYDNYNKPPMKKSSSLPISNHNEIVFNKPTPIEALLTTTSKQRTIKKKKLPEKKKEEEEDEPMTKPLSLTEKRKRQAKRADQVKIWKVREEREAREARLLIRRQLVYGTTKTTESTTTTTTTAIRKKKKRVKFNFDKNSIITFQYEHDE